MYCMNENKTGFSPYERLQLFVGKRQINRERRSLARVGAAVMSISMLMAIDITNATVDTCYYSLDGRGDSIEDVAASLRWHEPPENCSPSIETN